MAERSVTDLENLLGAEYPQTAAACVDNIAHWTSGQVPLVDAGPLDEFLRKAPLDLIHDSFWRRLPFGTGGVRGTVGFGPNRVNRSIIALTAQAHCQFLAGEYGDLSGRCVVVANDVRAFNDIRRVYGFMTEHENPLLSISARSLAWLVAHVYAANGLTVYMGDPDDDDAFVTTPELSFLIRHMEALGGVNLSASHNPPDDNGIKVYDAGGGQYLPPHDQKLADVAASMSEVRLDEQPADGAIQPIPGSAIDAYQQSYIDQFERHGIRSTERAKLLFTPLNGCGERTVVPILEAMGYDVTVPADQGPDGTFAIIPLNAPNPEVPVATQPARDAADAAGLDIVFSADPDADRLGIQYRDDEGIWHHVNGNQIATVLAYFLVMDPEGPQLRGGVYQTLVTTLAVREIGRQGGANHVEDDLYVGFKYIAGALLRREEAGVSGDDLIAFACEESHGYLATAAVREKDAVSAAGYLAAIHERTKAKGQHFGHYLQLVSDAVGAFGDCGRSLVLEGSAGMESIKAVMASLRADPPSGLGRTTATRVVDHWQPELGVRLPIDEVSDTEVAARNIVVFDIDGGRITVRPSGTEPKLKFYVQTVPSHWSPADAVDIAREVYGQLLAILDLELTAEAIDLPDVLPVATKVQFDQRVRSAMAPLADGDVAAALAGVQTVVSELVPGDGALRTVSGTVAAMARQVDGVDATVCDEFIKMLDR
ncbi:MAG: hypothetical protein AAFN30_00200 [Actinomycetota bacterium]